MHIVHVYVMEAHPGPPDPAPFRGLAGREEAPRQSRTYEDRVEMASTTNAMLEGSQLMLVDELAPLARTNPMWCAYGPAANSAFLVGQDGRILEAHDWLDIAEMKSAIDNLLSE